MLQERQKADYRDLLREAKWREDQLAARQVLDEQMKRKLELERQAQEEYERERKLVDSIVAKIQQEDDLELINKKEKQVTLTLDIHLRLSCNSLLYFHHPQ